jgi:pilus assembly protein CpaE
VRPAIISPAHRRALEATVNERILIVDDDPDALTLIGLTLERRGYTVLKASGGAEALMLADSEQPDLVLLDLMMPHMDGYEVCRRLKSDPRLADIPIVMLTAKAQMASQVEGYRVGADDYVTKPVHPDDLASHIHSVLERTHERQSKDVGGRLVAVIGVKGGVGTTTMAVNIGVCLAATQRAILADFDASGIAAVHLGFSAPADFTQIASHAPDEIDALMVERVLLAHESGVRVLPSSGGSLVPDQAVAVADRLTELCDVSVMDLGGGMNPVSRALLGRCDLVLVAIDLDRAAVLQTQRMLLALTEMGLNRSRLRFVWANRAGLDTRQALNTIKTAINEETIHVIDSAADSAYQSVETGRPLVLSAPDAPAAKALRELSELVLAATHHER